MASREQQFSYWQRRLARHLLIALSTLACSALFWRLFAVRKDLISHISIATAYPALFLTAAAVVLGPWNVLRGRSNPVSFDLRRDLGIWAAIMAIVHTGFGLNVHLRGRPWLYFADEYHHIRHDAFGFANDSGLIAALLFLLLLAISNDLSLRRLGTRKWKSLQRWTYAAVALTIAHAVAYQHVEKRLPSFQVVLWSATIVIAAFQFSGLRRIYFRRSSERRNTA
jgi:sulfoxide reductase heme-binding subunit YedZ